MKKTIIVKDIAAFSEWWDSSEPTVTEILSSSYSASFCVFYSQIILANPISNTKHTNRGGKHRRTNNIGC